MNKLCDICQRQSSTGLYLLFQYLCTGLDGLQTENKMTALNNDNREKLSELLQRKYYYCVSMDCI